MTTSPLAASNPQYADGNGTYINLTIEHPEFGTIPFTAGADDAEAMGRDLYVRAVAGEFGDIAAYDGPDPQGLLVGRMRTLRNRHLAQLDALVANPMRWASFPPAYQEALAVYRQALLDVPQQDGFPDTIHWPLMPKMPGGDPTET